MKTQILVRTTMKTTFRALVLAVWCLVCGPGAAWGDGERSKSVRPPAPRHASGHVLVRFKPDAREVVAAHAAADRLPALVARFGLAAGAGLREPPVARLIRLRKQKAAAGAAAAAAVAEGVSFDRFLYLDLPPGLAVEEAVHRLENHPLLEYVEPDFFGTAAETIPITAGDGSMHSTPCCWPRDAGGPDPAKR